MDIVSRQHELVLSVIYLRYLIQQFLVLDGVRFDHLFVSRFQILLGSRTHNQVLRKGVFCFEVQHVILLLGPFEPEGLLSEGRKHGIWCNNIIVVISLIHLSGNPSKLYLTEFVFVSAVDPYLCILEVHMLDPVVEHLEILVLLHVNEVLQGFNDDDQLLFVLFGLANTGHQNVLVLFSPGFHIDLRAGVDDHVKLLFFAGQLFVRVSDQRSVLVELNRGYVGVNLKHFL